MQIMAGSVQGNVRSSAMKSSEPRNIKCEIIPSSFEWIKDESPGFSACGSQIRVLFTPEEFYSSLIEGCCRATSRIVLAALYIGTGSLEKKLVEELDGRMRQCGPGLKVSILLDAVRDSRDGSARTQLLPLIQNHPHCQVSLYHTPELRGLWRRLLPPKVNEAIGIQHIKLYIFDDDVIISGANLTKEYFTDRQDRYMLMSQHRRLADFYHGLIEQICSVSLRLTKDNSLEAREANPHPYLSPSGLYEKHAREVIWGYYQRAMKHKDNVLKPGDDTWLFPLLQLPPFMVLQDSSVTEDIFKCLPANSMVHLSSPYFNLTEQYILSLLQKCKAPVKILIPHPSANDFFGARGFAGQIPYLYTLLADHFLQRVQSSGQERRVTVQEFERPHGSFHSKGLWLTTAGDELPYMTVIGSSNFNYRSVKRDLECQMVVMTSNRSLRSSLQEEKLRLYRHGLPFSREVALRPDRKPKLWQHLFLWLFKGYF